MVNWTITATTIYCDAVDDEVTLLVYKDGTAKCTGHRKYGHADKGAKASKKRVKQSKQQLNCEPSRCQRLMQYRDKVLAESTK